MWRRPWNRSSRDSSPEMHWSTEEGMFIGERWVSDLSLKSLTRQEQTLLSKQKQCIVVPRIWWGRDINGKGKNKDIYQICYNSVHNTQSLSWLSDERFDDVHTFFFTWGGGRINHDIPIILFSQNRSSYFKWTRKVLPQGRDNSRALLHTLIALRLRNNRYIHLLLIKIHLLMLTIYT